MQSSLIIRRCSLLSLTIQDHKEFMNRLFLSDLFDAFEVVSLKVVTFCAFSVNGSYVSGFFSDNDADHPGETAPSFASWKLLRPYVLGLIRGKNKPESMHIVFRLSDRFLPDTAVSGLSVTRADIAGLYLNITYSRQEKNERGDQTEKITCVTGTSLRVFMPDRSLEQFWDEYICHFLKKAQIAYT